MYSVEGGRQISQPPSTCIRGVAVPCHFLVLGRRHLFGFRNRKWTGGQSEGVRAVTMERGWWITAKLAHYFGMIWALSAGREGLSPTQSLIGDGCLSLSVCVHSCACVGTLVLVHVHPVCVNVCTYVWALWKGTPPPLDKLRVCLVKHAHCQLCQVCLCVCVCVRACVWEREQVRVIKTVDLIFLFFAKKHLLTLYVYSLSLYNH